MKTREDYLADLKDALENRSLDNLQVNFSEKILLNSAECERTAYTELPIEEESEICVEELKSIRLAFTYYGEEDYTLVVGRDEYADAFYTCDADGGELLNTLEEIIIENYQEHLGLIWDAVEKHIND